MPNALLVYPEFPPSYWGMNFALDFVAKKSSMPPLGLLTVAALFPKRFELKVIDMNVECLTDAHLAWADLVLTSTMIIQKNSLHTVIERCKQAGVPVIAGGPYPTSFYKDIQGVDHFVLGEVEDILGEFLSDFENGTARKIYRTTEKPDITRTPLPRYDLIDLNKYSSMALQFSRGCPFNCEFCDITKLFGRLSRTKTNEQVLAEFDLLYRLGWRGSVFLVDDNFIGNKKAALRLLPEAARWQKERNYPFSLFTEASVNLARMDTLMETMVEAGFSMVFLGIETTNPGALLKTRKRQNTSRADENYLRGVVRKSQQAGMEVMGGFILGLDGDDEKVFDTQIQFIQEAGIPMAMVGLLSVLKGTDLYERLRTEGRLLQESGGDNVSIAVNFIPEMERDTLISGYKRVLRTIYDPSLKNYFQRSLTMLEHLRYTEHAVRKIKKSDVLAFLKSIKKQLFSRQGPAYLQFLTKVAARHREMFPEAVRLAIMGYHFERVTDQQIAVQEFKEYLENELRAFRQAFFEWETKSEISHRKAQKYVQNLAARVVKQYRKIHRDFQYAANDALNSFSRALHSYLDNEKNPLGS